MGVSKNNGTPKSSILIGFSIINQPFWGTHIFAGGLKTGPIFKRFADMCDKRTRWIHCYLQYFVHFQCSLHGHADSQIFVANLRQKKTSNFQNMHFVRVSCTFCQKNVQIVFSFSTCQIVRVGWGGGGMITFLEHAHMFGATQIGGFGILTFFELAYMLMLRKCAHMLDATQIGFFGMLTFFELAYMLMLRKCAHMFDAIRKCAHMFELRKLVSSGC